jgi:hypothetical protein
METYLFFSDTDEDVFAFTSDPEGENLPAEFAPWLKNGDGAALYIGPEDSVTSNPVLRAVRRDGFYLARSARPADS